MKTFSQTILFLIFALPFSVGAQIIELPTEYIRNTLNKTNDLPINIQGSMYVDENFKEGTVIIGDKSFQSQIRYNAFEDAFEIKNPSNEITTLLRRPDIKVSIGDSNYQVESYINEEGETKQGYFKQLRNAETDFLLKQGITFTEAKKAASTYGTDKPASLELYEKHFIKKGDAPAQEVRLKKKDILKLLSDERVKDYVKENRLKLKNEAEVIQVLEFYDTL